MGAQKKRKEDKYAKDLIMANQNNIMNGTLVNGQAQNTNNNSSPDKEKTMFHATDMINEGLNLYADEIVIDPSYANQAHNNYEPERVTVYECYSCGNHLRDKASKYNPNKRSIEEEKGDIERSLSKVKRKKLSLSHLKKDIDSGAEDFESPIFPPSSINGIHDEADAENELEIILGQKLDRYPCTLCGTHPNTGRQKSFSHRSRLANHVKEYHPEYLEKHPQLRYLFIPQFANSNHKKLAAMEEIVYDKTKKEYICIKCGKTFKTPRHTVRHVEIVHRGVREATCEICGKHFTSKSRLKEHMMIHTGEKPFDCCYCSKAFRRKDKMKEHKRTMHPNEYAQEKELEAM